MVRDHDRVVVDVDDPVGRVGLLDDFVHVRDRGKAGADVEELPHAGGEVRPPAAGPGVMWRGGMAVSPAPGVGQEWHAAATR
jgi:hypothetical protein